MAFKILRNVRPLFNGVMTTAVTYKGNVTTSGGLIYDTTKMEGTMNPYQRVVFVGKMVTDVKPGDIVYINFKRYAKVRHVPGAIEDNVQSDNMSMYYEIPMLEVGGQQYLRIQNNDIEFAVAPEDCEIDEGGLLQ